MPKRTEIQTNLVGRYLVVADTDMVSPGYAKMRGERCEIVAAYLDEDRSLKLAVVRPDGTIEEVYPTGAISRDYFTIEPEVQP